MYSFNYVYITQQLARIPAGSVSNDKSITPSGIDLRLSTLVATTGILFEFSLPACRTLSTSSSKQKINLALVIANCLACSSDRINTIKIIIF